jgi:hypothetical protein
MRKRAGFFVLNAIFLAALSAAFGWAQEAKITVLNPRGIQPKIRRIPMAARPATLDGKTIYVVDTRYPRTREFVEELFSILKTKYPGTKWVVGRDQGKGRWNGHGHRALKHLCAVGRRPLRYSRRIGNTHRTNNYRQVS